MSETITTTYVTYYYPDAFLDESSSKPVATRDPQAIAAESEPGVFAFTFHDQVTTTVMVDGYEVPTASKALNESGMYYIDAQQMTAADVVALPGDHRILLSNMEANGWDPILRCRTGNFKPMQPGDEIIYTSAAVR